MGKDERKIAFKCMSELSNRKHITISDATGNTATLRSQHVWSPRCARYETLDPHFRTDKIIRGKGTRRRQDGKTTGWRPYVTGKAMGKEDPRFSAL